MQKKQIISQIETLDNQLGYFHKNGNYRLGVKFYYGKLEKYNKDKLIGILNNLLKAFHKKEMI